MRNDVGMHTISQRITGLASLRTSLQPAVPAVPTGPTGTTGTGATPAFGEALQAELAALGAGATEGSGGQRLLTQADLGAGVSLHGQASTYLPASPTVPGLLTGAHPGGCACSAHGAGTAGVEAVGAADHDGHVHAPPALDRQGPPAELQAHGNGRIPADALAPIGVGEHRLWEPAAHAFTDMMAAAQRDGVTIGVNSSYRSYEGQVEMVERYGLYSQGGRAAAPGTSNHGWGVAIDLQLDDAAQEWMRANAADYGFVEDVPREPWHWTFKASSY